MPQRLKDSKKSLRKKLCAASCLSDFVAKTDISRTANFVGQND